MSTLHGVRFGYVPTTDVTGVSPQLDAICRAYEQIGSALDLTTKIEDQQRRAADTFGLSLARSQHAELMTAYKRLEALIYQLMLELEPDAPRWVGDQYTFTLELSAPMGLRVVRNS